MTDVEGHHTMARSMNPRKYLPAFLAVLALAVSPATSMAQELESLLFVEGLYLNPAYTVAPPPGSNAIATNGVSLFSGNVGGPAGPDWNPGEDPLPNSTPNDGAGTYLAQSSIGWPTAATAGWVVSPGEVTAQKPYRNAAEYYALEGDKQRQQLKQKFQLFYANTEANNPETIYLNYDFITSGGVIHGTGSTQPIDPIFQAELTLAAKRNIYVASRLDPYLMVPQGSNEPAIPVVDVLLDIPYYQSVALIMQGNLALEKAFTLRFLSEIRLSGEIIDQELQRLGWTRASNTFNVQNYEYAWANFRDASRIWAEVFKSPLQRELLKTYAAARSLSYADHPVFKTDPPDNLVGGDWPPTVYAGYKDVAVMLRALAQRGRVVEEVSRRMVLKQDRERAAKLALEHLQQIALEEGIINRLFFPDGLPEDHSRRYPGLAESIGTLRDVTSRLTELRAAAINPDLNALGLDENVLFVRELQNLADEAVFDTFEWLSGRLYNAVSGSAVGALANAIKNDGDARTLRTKFRLKASEYLTQFTEIEKEYNSRMIALAGADPRHPDRPNLVDPFSGGGQIQLQNDNIALAVNQIERVQRQMDNVRVRVEIEQERVAQVLQLGVRRAELTMKVGNESAELTKKIGEIQANMALANAATQSVISAASMVPFKEAVGAEKGIFSSGVGAAAHLANGFIQANGQRQIAQKQAAIVRLQAEQQATFAYLNNEQAQTDSAAQIKTWFLELRTLEIDMLDATIRLGQETQRLASYLNELENNVLRKERAEQRLTQRSFADPTYRIEVTDAALRAENSFRRAQTWMFLLTKSYAYKYPKLPVGTTDLVSTQLGKVLVARTTDELEGIHNELFEADTTGGGAGARSWHFWTYSIRKDHFGIRSPKEDPATGSIATPAQQFQEVLIELLNNPGSIVSPPGTTAQYLSVPFSTVKFDIEDDNDTTALLSPSVPIQGQPPRISATPIFDSTLWDAKIDWIQVNLEGANISAAGSSTMSVQLLYGGTGFLRTQNAVLRDNPDFGRYENAPPRRLVDYLTVPHAAYEFNTTGNAFEWRAKPYIRATFSAKLVSQPRDVPDVTLRSLAFRERPVAATDWRILIPIDGTNFQNIRDIEINIIYAARTRQSKEAVAAAQP